LRHSNKHLNHLADRVSPLLLFCVETPRKCGRFLEAHVQGSAQEEVRIGLLTSRFYDLRMRAANHFLPIRWEREASTERINPAVRISKDRPSGKECLTQPHVAFVNHKVITESLMNPCDKGAMRLEGVKVFRQ